jgi:hypothetical protein
LNGNAEFPIYDTNYTSVFCLLFIVFIRVGRQGLVRCLQRAIRGTLGSLYL